LFLAGNLPQNPTGELIKIANRIEIVRNRTFNAYNYFAYITTAHVSVQSTDLWS